MHESVTEAGAATEAGAGVAGGGGGRGEMSLQHADVSNALNILGRAYGLTVTEIEARLSNNKRACAAASPAELTARFVRLWTREVLTRVVYYLDAVSLARLLAVASWGADSCLSTLSIATAAAGFRKEARVILSDPALRSRVLVVAARSHAHAVGLMLTLLRSRELAFREEFGGDWRRRWSVRAARRMSLRKITHAGVSGIEMTRRIPAPNDGAFDELVIKLEREHKRPPAPRTLSYKFCLGGDLHASANGQVGVSVYADSEQGTFGTLLCCFVVKASAEEPIAGVAAGACNLILGGCDVQLEPDDVTLLHDVKLDQWYEVRFVIDWAARHLDAFIDGRLAAQGVRMDADPSGDVDFPMDDGRISDICLYYGATAHSPVRFADIRQYY